MSGPLKPQDGHDWLLITGIIFWPLIALAWRSVSGYGWLAALCLSGAGVGILAYLGRPERNWLGWHKDEEADE